MIHAHARHHRRPRPAAALLLAILASAALVAPTTAMVNGTTDGDAHPAVGMMGTAWSGGDFDGDFRLACSGTLIAPRVYLTAAHCVRATNFRSPGPIYLWFGAEQLFGPVTTPGVVTGVGIIHPAYKTPYRNDIAVVILDQPYVLDSYPDLPAVGLLDTMQANKSLASATFTVVGYGVSEQVIEQAVGPVHFWTGERQSGVLGFNSLTKLWINQTQQISQGYQGACNGDSGGPSFLGSGDGETNVLVAVTSTGDIPCYATNVASRTDTAVARDWIQGWIDTYAE